MSLYGHAACMSMEGCWAGGQGQVGQQKVQLYYEERRRTTLPIWVYNLSIMVRVLVEQDSSAETLNTGLNIIYILSDSNTKVITYIQ